MRDRYRLQSLNDADLITAQPLLAQRDNANTADLLAHLAELDERKLYLDLGFRSIWDTARSRRMGGVALDVAFWS